MSILQLSQGVYSVGVLNPSLRVFDIVMRTDYGTTYNSYLIDGGEKKALVETVHASFFDEYVENIRQICDPAEIDYIIFNHTEPDHSGSLYKLSQIMPKAKIVCSVSASKFLPEIANRPLDIMVVGDGAVLEVGSKKLRFVNAPFLHWPDSMFTIIDDEGIAFTCDFFGSHYCEPRMIDKYITYPEAYNAALKLYYDAIFGPFAKYVRAGLSKLKQIPLKLVCVSHGPVLTEHSLASVIERYEQWSADVKHEEKQIEIFYVSAYGCTRKAAQKISEGIKSIIPNANVGLWDVIYHDQEQLTAKLCASDAFLIGTPTINRDALPPMLSLLSHVDAVNLAGRPCAAFGSYGWSGEGVPNILSRMQSLRLKVFEEDFRFRFVPSDNDLQGAFEFGAAFAKSLL